MKYILVTCALLLFLGCSNKPADVAALYKDNCASCHGKQGELRAFGKSEVIYNWSEDDLRSALIGYQEGTFGGSMKGLMRTEVDGLTRAQIDALAEYISSMSP